MAVDAPDDRAISLTASWSVEWPAALTAVAVMVAAVAMSRGVLDPARPRVRALRPEPSPRPGRPARGRRRRLRRRLGAVGVALAAIVVVGPLLVGVAVGSIWVVGRIRPIVDARRRRRAIERAMPDAIELFILTTQAGFSPVQAVRELASTAPADTRDGFVATCHRLDRGEPFALAVRALPERLGPGLVGFADLVGSADRHGTPIGPVLETLALDVRATRRRLDEADARRLPVRLSFPLVVCTLPSFVLLAIAPAVIAALASLDLSF